MTLDERIDEELKTNPELKEIFDKYPERRKLYKQKIIDSENAVGGSAIINPAYCRTCIFCKVLQPFGRLPENFYCKIFSDDTTGKPNEVYYDGVECEFYESE